MSVGRFHGLAAVDIWESVFTASMLTQLKLPLVEPHCCVSRGLTSRIRALVFIKCHQVRFPRNMRFPPVKLKQNWIFSNNFRNTSTTPLQMHTIFGWKRYTVGAATLWCNVTVCDFFSPVFIFCLRFLTSSTDCNSGPIRRHHGLNDVFWFVHVPFQRFGLLVHFYGAGPTTQKNATTRFWIVDLQRKSLSRQSPQEWTTLKRP